MRIRIIIIISTIIFGGIIKNIFITEDGWTKGWLDTRRNEWMGRWIGWINRMASWINRLDRPIK